MDRSKRIENIITNAVMEILQVIGEDSPIRAMQTDRRVGRPSPNRLLSKTDLPDLLKDKLEALEIYKVGQLITYMRDSDTAVRKGDNITHANTKRIKEFLGE
jgi:hypothetical protein